LWKSLKELIGTVCLGIFFATFWLTFAYGVFRWIKRDEPPETPLPKS